jgi:hypothetical protein
VICESCGGQEQELLFSKCRRFNFDLILPSSTRDLAQPSIDCSLLSSNNRIGRVGVRLHLHHGVLRVCKMLMASALVTGRHTLAGNRTVLLSQLCIAIRSSHESKEGKRRSHGRQIQRSTGSNHQKKEEGEATASGSWREKDSSNTNCSQQYKCYGCTRLGNSHERQHVEH